MAKMLSCLCLAALCLSAQAAADTITCPATSDVYIDQGTPDDSQGHRTRVLVSWHNTYLAARGLWRFAIPAELQSEDITSAVMWVSRSSTTGAGSGIDVDVYALNTPFAEDTDTWNTLGGGDYDPSVVASGTLPAWATPPPCTASIDLTALLQGNLDKVRDFGILMLVQDEGSGANRFQNFATKEDTPPSTGAYLEITVGGGTGVPAPPVARVALAQNRPNPFNPQTVVTFTLESPQNVDLTVYDLAGRPVRALRRGPCEAGSHPIAWDGADDRGCPMSSGVYVFRLATADGARRTVKAVLSR
ncbi:MAG: DNRLRE domain-containing protein [Candidatus Krumholzibacteria bacterium]|nr:DNRLRE domain-containing protein [Candidatus Krumholzibacteria bacterium]